MNLRWCKSCDRYHYFDSEKCDPKWSYRIDDYHGEDDWENVIVAKKAEDAARKVAEEYDHEEHPLMQGGEIVVHVRGDNGEVKRFSVTGEAVPEYYARELT